MTIQTPTTEDDVERVARALWRAEWYGDEAPLTTWDAEVAENPDGAEGYRALARAALSAIDREALLKDERERAWRDGFQCARECLTDDGAFCLTVDVEEDCWLDSKTRESPPPVGQALAHFRALAASPPEQENG